MLDRVEKWPTFPQQESTSSAETQDLFTCEGDTSYAGKHLLLDIWDASHLDNLELIEKALRTCVEVAGAHLLHIHLHKFSVNGGISGVAVLAESHISIHSWPERSYAALDIFMCGNAQPEKCVDVLCEAFATSNFELKTHLRGETYNGDPA